MLFIFNYVDLQDFIRQLGDYLAVKGPLSILQSVIDIGIVSFIVYRLILLVKETRAMQLIKGILVILAAKYLSQWLGLRTIEFILNNSIQIVGFALVVIFQPELRRGLEQIGRSKFKDFFSFDEESTTLQTTAMIEEIVKATSHMASNYVGSLVVVERVTKIGEIINSGIQIDANVSAELLKNIFAPNAPLHDGAVVIRENKIKAASCFLPLTDNPNLSKELGTRHRAALGITEVSDAIVIVVSEESGKISFALNGGLTRNLTTDTLRKALNRNLINKKDSQAKISSLWRVKSK